MAQTITVTNRGDAHYYQVDYNSFPELERLVEEVPQCEKFLNLVGLGYRCIRDTKLEDDILYNIYFGLGTAGILYPVGAYLIEPSIQDTLKHKIEKDEIRVKQEVIEEIAEAIRKKYLEK